MPNFKSIFWGSELGARVLNTPSILFINPSISQDMALPTYSLLTFNPPKKKKKQGQTLSFMSSDSRLVHFHEAHFSSEY